MPILTPEPYEATIETLSREELVVVAKMWYNKYLGCCKDNNALNRENRNLQKQIDDWQRSYFVRDS